MGMFGQERMELFLAAVPKSQIFWEISRFPGSLLVEGHLPRFGAGLAGK